MKEIPLTQGKVALVDDEDYEMLAKYRWYALRSFLHPTTYYAARTCMLDGKKYQLFMHRQILGLKRGDKREGDHQDSNGLNNQRYNLRICTHAQNACNQEPQRRRKSSRCKGVCWHKAAQSWMTYFKIDGKQHYLGLFSTEIAAASAYNEATEKYFGEFALPNKLAGMKG